MKIIIKNVLRRTHAQKLAILIFLLLLSPAVLLAQSDSDGDGIPDSADVCPTEGDWGLGLDESGCPHKDTDGDGVFDSVDACPSRGNEYGNGVDASGCPIPSANADNSPAQENTEPADNPTNSPQNPEPNNDETAAPTRGAAQNQETSPRNSQTGDRDWDGMPDSADACPTEGDWGLGLDESGCPYRDTDGDGVYDREDTCPQRGNEGGLGVDESGCPYYDTDWDAVYDREDACPSRADEYGYGVMDNGCPRENNLPVPDNDNPQPTELEERLSRLADLGIPEPALSRLEETFINDAWSLDMLDTLIDNYIARLITLGYTQPDIEGIIATVARNQNYQPGAPDYNYVYEDLERMIGELENFYQGDFTTAIRMYPINMIDRSVPHLFPPNPFKQPIIFLMHGWGVDGAQQNAYVESADWFMQEFAALPINQQPILIGIDWDADYIEVEPEPAAYPQDLREILLNFRAQIDAIIGLFKEALEFSDVLYYDEIEAAGKSTGEQLGYWIEQNQAAYAPSVSFISHSMGAHVGLAAVDYADILIDNFLMIQAPVGPYDAGNALIDNLYADVLGDEVENVFVTYNANDLAINLYQTFIRLIFPQYTPISPLSPIRALGSSGLWESWVYTFFPLGDYQALENVSNFEITKSPEDEGTGVEEHQVMNLARVWQSVQEFIAGIFTDLFTLLNL